MRGRSSRPGRRRPPGPRERGACARDRRQKHGPSGDVAKREVKEQNTGDPAVNRRVRLNVRVIDHTFNVLRVDLDDEILRANNERPSSFECTKQSIELDLRLRVPLFTFVPGDRAKARGVPFLVIPHLRENKPGGHP